MIYMCSCIGGCGGCGEGRGGGGEGLLEIKEVEVQFNQRYRWLFNFQIWKTVFKTHLCFVTRSGNTWYCFNQFYFKRIPVSSCTCICAVFIFSVGTYLLVSRCSEGKVLVSWTELVGDRTTVLVMMVNRAVSGDPYMSSHNLKTIGKLIQWNPSVVKV